MNATQAVPNSKHSKISQVLKVDLPEIVWNRNSTACFCEANTLEDHVRVLVGTAQGKRAVQCNRCDAFVSEWNFTSAGFSPEITRSYVEALANRTPELWHMTLNLNWSASFGVDFDSVHAGSRYAAWNRIFDRISEEGLTPKKLASTKIHAYRLTLNKNAVVGPPVRDMTLDWETPNDSVLHPYMNQHEFPGSISVFGHTSAFSIVDHEEIDFLSVYSKLQKIIGV